MPQFVAVLRRSDGLSRRPWGRSCVSPGDGNQRTAPRGQPSRLFSPTTETPAVRPQPRDDVDMLKLKLKVDKVRMLVVASVS